jgi:hypothetical protein
LPDFQEHLLIDFLVRVGYPEVIEDANFSLHNGVTMMRGMNILILGFFCLSALTGEVCAQSKPISLGLVTPVQIVPKDMGVAGFRLSLIYGQNTNVTGVDLGLINHTTSGTSMGIQWGLMNLNDADFVGWQNSWVNLLRGRGEGLQSGLYTQSSHMSGLQIGLVNNSETLHGLQIGLLNIIAKGGFLPIFPIVNWSF